MIQSVVAVRFLFLSLKRIAVFYLRPGPLIQMGFTEVAGPILIPAVFVSETTGQTLRLLMEDGSTVAVEMYGNRYTLPMYLQTFVVVVGITSLVFTVFLYFRRRAHLRANPHLAPPKKMTKKQLLKLPVRGFRSSDNEDVCCVCLDAYSEGDRIVALPCGHIFHKDCIAKWLTEQRRVCPMCKADPLPDESTPLLGEHNRVGAGVPAAANENRDGPATAAGRARAGSTASTTSSASWATAANDGETIQLEFDVPIRQEDDTDDTDDEELINDEDDVPLIHVDVAANELAQEEPAAIAGDEINGEDTPSRLRDVD